MMGRFLSVQENMSESKCREEQVMVLNGKEGLESEILLNERVFDHVSEFKYLASVLEKSGTHDAMS